MPQKRQVPAHAGFEQLDEVGDEQQHQGKDGRELHAEGVVSGIFHAGDINRSAIVRII